MAKETSASSQHKPVFKIGEKVRVKPASFFLNHPKYNETHKEIYEGQCFVSDMFDYCGMEFVIREIRENSKGIVIIIDNSWSWNDWMFEKINKQLELF